MCGYRSNTHYTERPSPVASLPGSEATHLGIGALGLEWMAAWGFYEPYTLAKSAFFYICIMAYVISSPWNDLPTHSYYLKLHCSLCEIQLWALQSKVGFCFSDLYGLATKSVVQIPAASAASGWQCRSLDPHLRSIDQNLYFNTIPRWFASISKFELHHSGAVVLPLGSREAGGPWDSRRGFEKFKLFPY